MILGAGIYSVIGSAADLTQESLWISFLLAALTALLTGLSYCELATMFPSAGGEFVYIGHVFKKKQWIAKTIGMLVAFSGAASCATVSIAFSGYLGNFLHISPIVSSTILIIVISIINLIGIRQSATSNVIFTLVEIAGLILFISLGFQKDHFGEVLSAPLHWGVVSGTALIIFAYFGFENIVNLAQESKKPERDLPRAILLSLTISTILYFLVALAALALLTPAKLATSQSVLSDAAYQTSEIYAKILGVTALFSTANTALIAQLSASRVIYAMARVKSIPLIFAGLISKRKTPWAATLIVMLTTLALLPLGSISLLASIAALATILCFCLVNVAVATCGREQIL